MYNNEPFVGSVEALFMAIDMTADLPGVWRIPLTFETKKGGHAYAAGPSWDFQKYPNTFRFYRHRALHSGAGGG